MGNKPLKEDDSTPRTPSPRQRYVSSATGSLGDERPTKTHLYRNRAGNRMSLQVKSLVEKVSQLRKPREKSLYEQRFRDGLPSIFSGIQAENPRFKRTDSITSHKSLTNRINRLSSRFFKNKKEELEDVPVRKKSQRTRASRASRILEDVPLKDLTDINLNVRKAKTSVEADKTPKLLIRSSKTDVKKHSPRPPTEKKLKLPYATSVVETPFESFNNEKDYRSFRFSSLSLTEEERREAATNMILCTINSDFIHKEKLDFTSNKKRTLRGLPKRLNKSLKKNLNLRSTPGKKRFPIEPPSFISDEVREAVEEYVDLVADNYTSTKYHSFAHAVDVTQMMFMLVYFLYENLSHMDPFILLTASLSHDVGHFGANSNFLAQQSLTNNRFLQKFGRKSLLEKYHCFVFKKICERCSLFSGDFMESHNFDTVINTAHHLILATDMERHTEIIDGVKEEIRYQKNREQNDDLPMETEKEFQPPPRIPLTFLSLCIKVCDVINVAREFNDAKTWAVILSQEFQAMGGLFNEPNIDEFINANVQQANNQLYGADDAFDVTATNKVFQVSDNLTSKCLIEYQNKCSKPNFADCSIMTLTFIKETAIPLAGLLNELNSNACWFVMDRIHLNVKSWGIAIKNADEENKENDE